MCLLKLPKDTTIIPLKSFIEAVNNKLVSTISFHKLPKPVKKGGHMCIKITKSFYKQNLQLCNTNLIGRSFLRPGSKPLKVHELHQLL